MIHTSLVQFGQELIELWTSSGSSVGVLVLFLLFFDVLSGVWQQNADEVPMKVSIPIYTLMDPALIQRWIIWIIT